MCWKFTTILPFVVNRTWHYIDTVMLWYIVLAWTDQNIFLETRCLVPHINSTITPVFQENSLIKVVCYHNQNYRENNQHKYVLSKTIADPNHKGGLGIPHRKARVYVCLFCAHTRSFIPKGENNRNHLMNTHTQFHTWHFSSHQSIICCSKAAFLQWHITTHCRYAENKNSSVGPFGLYCWFLKFKHPSLIWTNSLPSFSEWHNEN